MELPGFSHIALIRTDDGDESCKKAIEAYCYRVRSYIGQYIAVLNGCDAIVFTAGVGENSPVIRSMVCRQMDRLGIRLDEDLNNQAIGVEKRISANDSAVQIWTIPTNEELVIAQDTMKIAERRKSIERPMWPDVCSDW